MKKQLKMEQSFAYFPNILPLKTEEEVKEYMKDLGITHYGRFTEVVIDLQNLNLEKLNKNHPLYDRILKGLENKPKDGFGSFRI